MTFLDPYQAGAAAWDRDAAAVYGPLADELVAAVPVALRGRAVLDLGCGTGAATAALRRAGATVVSLDRSLAMLQHRRPGRPPAVNADAVALPIADGGFDAVVAAFLLNHLPPAEPLLEMARVLRPGGALAASTWPGGVVDPVKARVDSVMREAGWTAPEWYRVMKQEVELVTGDPDRLAALARASGFQEAEATVRTVAMHLDASTAVSYRLAVPHLAEFLAGLDAARRRELVDTASREVAPIVDSWQPSMLVLLARR